MTGRLIGRIGPAMVLLSCLFAQLLPAQGQAQPSFDVVILNGRVMDPATARDERANVGVRGGKIAAITTQPLHGGHEIDATGLIVAPGFIDILASLGKTRESSVDKVTDGVTTVFGMHGGPIDIAQDVSQLRKAEPLINYGRTVGQNELRLAVGLTDRYKPATDAQIQRMQELARQAIRAGAVGIGFGVNYTPGASHEEIFALFQICGSEKVPCHLHTRFKGNIPPETMSASIMEVIADAAATGARAEVAHLTSDTLGSAPLSIRLIEGAAAHGVDLAFDFHVWSRNETRLKSALYDPGWQERFGGISYSNIYVSATQEQLTKERFEELRQAPKDTMVQTESIPESEIELALRSPISIVSSDSGGLNNGKGHPRGRGTFARLLGLYVREKRSLSCMDALRKITILPARRLEESVPRMKNKGRLQVGADADITIFDPNTVRERATYAEPDRPSRGINYVLVNGTLVVDKGKIVPGVAPGEWLRHPAY